MTPAMGQLLTANASATIPSLAVALFVGDVLTKRDVKRLQRLAPRVVTVNMYGTTETQRAVSFLVSSKHLMKRRMKLMENERGRGDLRQVILGREGAGKKRAERKGMWGGELGQQTESNGCKGIEKWPRNQK